MVRLNGVAIQGYGGYVPRYRIRAEEIGRLWGREKQELPIEEKAVAGLDEDSVTMAVEAARIAVKRAGIDPKKIGAIHVGSESKPYAVKPTGTIVAEAIGAGQNILAADLEFACKAGTEAIQLITGLVESGRIEYGLAIGTDTAQGRPGDALEYTAASGAAALLIGRLTDDAVASIEAWNSYVTDTPDFWRRERENYPSHAARFTGQPAYFRHVLGSINELLNDEGYSIKDIDYFVFHQPNVKFPLAVAKALKLEREKVSSGLISGFLGNPYSATSLLGLVRVLDEAKPGDVILLASFGSGAGSDAYILRVLDGIEEKRDRAPKLKDFIDRKIYIDYASYARFRGKLRLR